MSIASAITAAQGRVADCYTAISAKGGTLPATQNLSNMPTAIASIPSGGTIDSLTITPTTSQQTITASGGVDGYSPITVNAVTSSIDNNITAGNIKSGVSILGVSGSLTELKGETRSVSLTNKNGQTFTPSSGKNGITSITVSPTNQAKTITPTTSQQTISVPSGYSGFGTLTVNAVTSSIDANITAGNIKKNVQILGVTGSYEGGGGGYTEFPSYQVSNGVASRRSVTLTGNEFTDITSIGDHGLSYAFYSSPNLSGTLNLSNLVSLGVYGLYYAFYYCPNLTSVDLSNLTSVSDYGLESAFYQCSKITSVNLSSLNSVSIYALRGCFNQCSRLTSVNISSLSNVATRGLQEAFRNCSGLQTITFNSLSNINTYGLTQCFQNCNRLQTVYFPSLNSTSFGSAVTQFVNLFQQRTSGTCIVHFPSNLESKISSLTGYPLFGGKAGTITLSFDLPATS